MLWFTSGYNVVIQVYEYNWTSCEGVWPIYDLAIRDCFTVHMQDDASRNRNGHHPSHTLLLAKNVSVVHD